MSLSKLPRPPLSRFIKAKLYPASLLLLGRKVLVVGAGQVAERKLKSLQGCGAKVECVAPAWSQGAKAALKRLQGKALKRKFAPADLKRAVLVFCATDNKVLNARIAQTCRKRGVWVNEASRALNSSFWVPAVYRKGRLSVAVASGGAGPKTAQKWRDQILKTLKENRS
jgi:siroheme synthase-like protein